MVISTPLFFLFLNDIKMAFVLVAGGLGERLGFSGIKLALPIDLASEETYLGTYCASILALQRRFGDASTIIPLAIMTSDDTHARTEALLEANNNFGMADGQVLVFLSYACVFNLGCLTSPPLHYGNSCNFMAIGCYSYWKFLPQLLTIFLSCWVILSGDFTQARKSGSARGCVRGIYVGIRRGHAVDQATRPRRRAFAAAHQWRRCVVARVGQRVGLLLSGHQRPGVQVDACSDGGLQGARSGFEQHVHPSARETRNWRYHQTGKCGNLRITF